MSFPENLNPQSVEEVSTLLKEKRLLYADLPEILANLRKAPAPPITTPTEAGAPASPTSEASSEKWNDRFFSKVQSLPTVSGPEIPPPLPASSPESIRSQLAALDESLKREQRYRQQFEAAAAKASAADTLRKDLSEAQQSLQKAMAHETTLQAEISLLKSRAVRLEGENEDRATLQNALNDARSEVRSFASRLKEAELRAALASHLESDLTNVRNDLAEARNREKELAAKISQVRHDSVDTDHLRAELEGVRTALADSINREETLHIQLAETQGAIAIARQIEAELAQSQADLKAAEARVLEAERMAPRPDPELLRELDQSHRSRQSAESRIAELQAICETAEKDARRLREAEGELERLHASIRDAEVESSRIRTALTDAQRHAGIARELEERLARTQLEMDRSKAAQQSLQHQLTEAGAETSHRMLGLTREIDDLRAIASRVPSLESDVATARGELESARSREVLLQQDSAALSAAQARISEIEANLAASESALTVARQTEEALDNQLRLALAATARVHELEAEIAQVKNDHTVAINLIEQLRVSLATAEEAAANAQELRREISSQVIALREAEVRRQTLESQIAQFDVTSAESDAAAQRREKFLQFEIRSLVEKADAARADGERQLAALHAEGAEIQRRADTSLAETTQSISSLQAELDTVRRDDHETIRALEADLAEATEQFSRLSAARDSDLNQARQREEQLAQQLDQLRAAHEAAITQAREEARTAAAKIEQLAASVDQKSAAMREHEVAHVSEIDALRAETEAALQSVQAEVADRDARISILTEKLSAAETDAAKLPQLLAELQTLQAGLEHSKLREGELSEKLAAIERAAKEIVSSLPKVSYGPDYQLRQHTGPAFAQHDRPFRTPRILQWIGAHPKQTLIATALAAAALVAGVVFLNQPSYSGIIDAPVKLLRSPVTGTILTAAGEPGISVIKGEPLFSIKNANDGSDRVRGAKDKITALEEEIALLSSLRAALVQRQLSRGLPGAGLGNRTLDFSPALRGKENDFPDAPNLDGDESGDYLAIRLVEVNAKLESTGLAMQSSKRALADAEAEFRANEKADVLSPAAGAIQTMHVSPGSPVEAGSVLAEIVSSEEAFIEAAIPQTLAADAVGRKVRVVLDGSSTPLDGEIVAVGPETGWNSKQTAVSLPSIPEGYVIVDIWIAQPGWSGDVGFASQIGRKAKITLK